MPITRRQFVALSTPALLSFGPASPLLKRVAAESLLKKQERILVVIQLTGGNDGLNTIVPYKHDAYRKARPSLALAERDVLKISDELGFHSAAKGLKALYDQGKLAVVQGVGYPNANLSHFESMDIWHTCLRKTENRPDGWLGRTVDSLQTRSRVDVPALHIGPQKQPFSLASRDHRVPSAKSLEQFRLELQQRESLGEIRANVTAERTSTSNLLNFVQTSTDTAINVSDTLSKIRSTFQTSTSYPDTALGAQLKSVAQLINAELGTRIYYLEIAGFDTHAEQADAHAALLKQVSESVQTFVADLDEHGHGDHVLTFCFSEFGRRVQENASQGTDHGRAAPVFLAGNKIAPGLIGEHPSLENLEQGDLQHHTDFRCVYAGLLENWLEIPSQHILHGKFKPLQLI